MMTLDFMTSLMHGEQLGGVRIIVKEISIALRSDLITRGRNCLAKYID